MAIRKRGGDFVHETCLVAQGAEVDLYDEVKPSQVEDDDVCGVCGEPLVSDDEDTDDPADKTDDD